MKESFFNSRNCTVSSDSVSALQHVPMMAIWLFHDGMAAYETQVKRSIDPDLTLFRLQVLCSGLEGGLVTRQGSDGGWDRGWDAFRSYIILFTRSEDRISQKPQVQGHGLVDVTICFFRFLVCD